MGSVGAGFSMSVDGFIAHPNGDPGQLFQWMFSGDTPVKVTMGDHELDLKMSAKDTERFEAPAIGAVVSGRGMFDMAKAWGGEHPMHVPVFIVTHRIPEEWANKPGAPFTFVTDGVESAVRQAQKVAGDKSVGVGGANVAQQCLKLGLLDEIGIDMVPVLFGKGIRMFEYLGIEPVQLESTSVTASPGVIHLGFRVLK